MPDAPIPADVRTLLDERIHTLEQLEAIILVRKGGREDWSGEEVADLLHISIESASEALQRLAQAGVLEAIELPAHGVRYRGFTKRFEALVDRLLEVYESNRIELMMLLSANAIERMRTGALRAFADAFVVGRKRKDG
jgi:Mn-dependent DtxR family transcriptional regulator